VVTKVDGVVVGAAPQRVALLAAGFVAGYRGLVLRPGADARSRAGVIDG
jgi:hypothetical protein